MRARARPSSTVSCPTARHFSLRLTGEPVESDCSPKGAGRGTDSVVNRSPIGGTTAVQSEPNSATVILSHPQDLLMRL